MARDDIDSFCEHAILNSIHFHCTLVKADIQPQSTGEFKPNVLHGCRCHKGEISMCYLNEPINLTRPLDCLCLGLVKYNQ